MSIFGKIIETYAYFNITMGLAVPVAYDESYKNIKYESDPLKDYTWILETQSGVFCHNVEFPGIIGAVYMLQKCFRKPETLNISQTTCKS